MEKLSKIDAFVCQCKNEEELNTIFTLSKEANINWCNGNIIDTSSDIIGCFRKDKDTLIFFSKLSGNILSIRYANRSKKNHLKNGFQTIYGLKCFVLDFKMFEKILYHYYIKTKRK